MIKKGIRKVLRLIPRNQSMPSHRREDVRERSG